MNRLQFYYNHSLVGYFHRRAKARWFTKLPPQVEISGVNMDLQGLHEDMRDVLLGGEYEDGELKILPLLISETDRVLEIGSAIGFLGIHCQKVLKVKRFMGVEPNPGTLKYLRRNYALNGIAPNIIEAAIAPVDGPVSFYTTEMFWSDSLQESSGKSEHKLITVEGLSFASLLLRAGPGFNALIIDVEGAEQYIPFDSLPVEVNKILIEIHPQVTGTRKAYGILECLIKSGFSVQAHRADCWALIRAGQAAAV